MKIFVTGATGFIGSHLVEGLIKDKKVSPSDIFALVRETGNVDLLKKLRVNLVFGNLEDKDSFNGSLSQADLIFHLAAQAHLRRPKKDYEVNIKGTKNIIDVLSQGKKRPRLVFLSSICAVDRSPKDNCRAPIDENSPPWPQTAYGKSKLEAENLIRKKARKGVFDYVILRPPLVFGPRNRLNSAVASFISGIKQRSLLFAFNFPGAFSLIYVKDLVKALILAARHPKAVNQVFFVANSEPVKVVALFDKIAAILGIERKVLPLSSLFCNFGYRVLNLLSSMPGVSRVVPKYKLNILKHYWVCSCKKIKAGLGFKASYILDEALAQTINWCGEQKI